MARFFSSDYHFQHRNIMKYGRGDDFVSLAHMQDSIIVNNNRNVGSDDDLYILGDVVMGRRVDSLRHVARLRGRRHLILGNHDYPHPLNPEKVVARGIREYTPYFDTMQTEMFLDIGGETVLLNHFPTGGDHTEEVRYPEHRPNYDGIILHGHLHCPDIVIGERHIHVGIDADYTTYGVERYHPIPEEVIAQVIKERM